jgi:hypothetical protein
MKITKREIFTVKLSADAMAVVCAGYCLRYPPSDSSWFRKQVIDCAVTRDELIHWLMASIDYTLSPMKETAEWLLNCITAGVTPGSDVVLLYDDEQATAPVVLEQVTEVEDPTPVLDEGETCMSEEDIKASWPRIAAMGLPVHRTAGGTAFVPRDVLHHVLDVKDEEIPGFRKRYGDMFGVQTMCYGGPYPWDVEAVLERMLSGKLTDTQLLWD